MKAAPLACQSRMSRIQLEEKRGSREKTRHIQRRGEERKGGGGDVGESRGHVNRYMLETHYIIHAAMRREGRNGKGGL